MNMKRIMISALAVLFAVAFSGSAYAAECQDAWALVDSGGCTTKTSGRAPQLKFKGSKNVSAYYTGVDAGLGYTIATYHSSGTKTYGSSNYDQKIFTFAEKTKTPPAADADGLDPGFVAAQWTSL